MGDYGAILMSADKGVAWDKVDSPVKTALAGVAWSGGDAPIALAVGKQGVIVVSLDRGKTWQAATIDDSVTFTAVAAVGDGFAAATLAGKVMRLSPADLRRYLKTPTAGQTHGHAAAAASDVSELNVLERIQRYTMLRRDLSKAAADKDYAKMIDVCQQQADLVGEPAFDHGSANYNLASLLARVGRKDDALKALNTAIDQGFSDVDRIKSNSDLKSLRADKRFDEAVRKAEHVDEQTPGDKPAKEKTAPKKLAM